MSEYQIIMTSMPDFEEAEQLAEHLLKNKLAACINILPSMVSIYRWKGALVQDQEHQLLIKTRATCSEAVISAIQDSHPYELPEIIAIPIINGIPSYLNWISECTELQ